MRRGGIVADLILADTSVWIDHLRAGDHRLEALLQECRVLSHPFVIGELALGSLRQRAPILDALDGLPRAVTADNDEVRLLIERHRLHGIGLIDAHLLAASLLTRDVALWTRDRRLAAAAARLGVAFMPASLMPD